MLKDAKITVEELASLEPTQVRNDEKLMRLYLEYFKDAFSYEPNCAPCTFTKDFKKLRNRVLTGQSLTTKIATMANMTKYKLKPKHTNTIHTYRVGGDPRPFRSYGHTMTDEFAEAYLKNGTKEQLKERRAMFEVINGKEVGAKKRKAPAKDVTIAPALESKESDQSEETSKEAQETEKQAGENETQEADKAGKYDPSVVNKMKRAQLDDELIANDLKPEDYATVKGAKEALLNL